MLGFLPAVTNRLSVFIGRVRSETGHLQRAMTDTLCIFCMDSCLWARMLHVQLRAWGRGVQSRWLDHKGGWVLCPVPLPSRTDTWTYWLV